MSHVRFSKRKASSANGTFRETVQYASIHSAIEFAALLFLWVTRRSR